MNGTNWSGRGNLESLVAELTRQKESRIDFVADTRALNAMGLEIDGVNRLVISPDVTTGVAVSEFMPKTGFPVNDNAFAQLCERSEPAIPVRYGRKLLEARPGVAGVLFDSTFCQRATRRFFRCLDGKVRAVLSDSYRVLDHYDVAFTALETVRDNGGEVIEATLDDRRMRLKFTTRAVYDVLTATKDGGDAHKFFGSEDWLNKTGGRWNAGLLPGGPGTVHPSVIVTNSETGDGGFGVSLGIMHAVCVNTSKVEEAVRGIHLGGKLDEGIFSEETVAAESKAVYLKARDAIRSAFQPDTFKRIIGIVKGSADHEIKSPTAAANLVAERLDLDERKRDAIMAFFLQDYASNALGLASAVSRASQDETDPAVAERWEDFSGELMRSPAKVLQGVA